MKTYSKTQKILFVFLPFVAVPAVFFIGRFVSNYTFLFLPCPTYTLLKLYCPVCGATRATTALLYGDVLLSLRQNPFVIIGVLLIALVYIEFLFKVFNKKLPFKIFDNMKLIWGVLISMGLFTVLRNIFPMLAPI